MHQVELFQPPYLIMAYDWDDIQGTQQQAFGTGELVDFLIGYQNDDVLLRVIA